MFGYLSAWRSIWDSHCLEPGVVGAVTVVEGGYNAWLAPDSVMQSKPQPEKRP